MADQNAKPRKASLSTKLDALAHIALWQLIAFVLLVLIVWANELLDLSYLIFGTKKVEFNPFRACVLTAAVIVAAVITVGHTYEQQKALVKRFLVSCSYCNRVNVERDNWANAEEYFLEHFPIPVSRTVCPDCQEMLKDLDTHVSLAGVKAGTDGAAADSMPGNPPAPSADEAKA